MILLRAEDTALDVVPKGIVRVVTSDVFRENHVRRTLSGRIQTSQRPDERPSRPTAGRRHERTASW
jgi:hypothetical protein